MAARRFRRVIPCGAAAYILGGSAIFAATMLPWVERNYTHVVLGLGTGEGQIMLLLGLLAILCGVLLTIIWVPQFEVLVGAVGCAIATTAITFGIHLREVYDFPSSSILGFGNLVSSPREGLWVLIGGGALVGAGALLCLAHGLVWLSVVTNDENDELLLA